MTAPPKAAGAARPPARPRTGRRSPARKAENRYGLTMVSPTMLVILGIVIIPFLVSVTYAFQELRLIDLGPLGNAETTWTLDNFRAIFANERYRSSLWITIIYSIGCTVGALIAGTAIALALRAPFRGRGAVRAMVLIPYVLPIVSAAMIWNQMLNTQYGVVNAFGREFLGWARPISFLTQTSIDVAGIPIPLALTVAVLFDVWKSAPLTYLFVMARLQSVPKSLEEAATLDGATPIQRFRHITLPEIAGGLGILTLLRFIWSFQSFNEIYLLTGGAGNTEVLAIEVYNAISVRGDIGAASALGLVLMLVLTVLTLAYVWASRRETDS